MFKQLLILLTFSSLLFSNEYILDNKKSDLHLTIYNNNLNMVHEKRTINLTKGNMNIIYEGVPESIIQDSVSVNFPKTTQLISQSYNKNQLTYNDILKDNLGKKVLYKSKGSYEVATLISINPIMVQLNNSKYITPLEKPSDIAFYNIPSQLKPSLYWKVNNQKNQSYKLNINYLTTGINWKGSYILNLDKKLANIQGWITITNNSGMDYNNANITCLSGTVKREEPHKVFLKALNAFNATDYSTKEVAIEKEDFSGYHIYKLPNKESLKDKETKQISFINQRNISYYQYAEGLFSVSKYPFQDRNIPFNNIIEINNCNKNNLGLDLPAGTVRLYAKDKTGESHFIGEDSIKNISNKERLELRPGQLYDIKATQKVTKYKSEQNHVKIAYETTIHNYGDKDILIRLKENVVMNKASVTIKDNCKDNCHKLQESDILNVYEFHLKSKKSYILSTEYDIKEYNLGRIYSN